MASKRSQSVPQRSMLRRSVRYGSVSLLLGGTIVGTGCLDRPVAPSQPVTTNVVVQRQINNAINAIDLLLMIDNSSSMADKQGTLAEAVPQLLGQLVQPACTNADGTPVLDNAGQPTHVLLGAGTCPNGGSPEFNPVNNIHIGIVTSSLGDHGGNNLCTPGKLTNFVNPDGTPINEPDDVNDAAHLVGTLQRYITLSKSANPTASATIDTQGFLAWGDVTKPPMSDNDLLAATGIFRDMVSSTHENGCGLEAQLEGWFRFLIDPVPPIYPIVKDDQNQAHRLGVDDILLAQRAAFLRPDSLVAVVMLTDENDCSLRDTDVGWVATDTLHSIKTGSSACASNPNDPCCYSCTASGPPGKCADGCANAGNAQDDGSFQANIRCFHQKRRFGYEFMYPTSRYVVGLTKPELCPDQSFGDMDCDCTYANSIKASCNPGTRKLPNPLYSTVVGTNNAGAPVNSLSATAIARTDNSVVFLAGIVGVPWQDLGYLDGNNNLVYIPVTDKAWTGPPSDPQTGGHAPINVNPNGQGIWANIYGDDNSNTVPQDVHMVESLSPRDGIATGDAINGGEWTTAFEDLEYACIYPLQTSKPCACDPNAGDYTSCKYLHPNDCCDLTFNTDGHNANYTPPAAFNKPLCNNNTQVDAKGYPGLREIAVLHDYALSGTALGNSIVASICPKDLTGTSAAAKASPGYGYNPAVAALVNRLKEKLKGSCLPRPLTVASNGTVPCNVVEVVSGAIAGADCNGYCQANGRNVDPQTGLTANVTAQMSAAVFDQLRKAGLCDTATSTACSSLCACLLPQESSSKDKLGSGDPKGDLGVCQNGDDGQANALDPGYCYVDPAATAIDPNTGEVVNVAGTNTDIVAKCKDTERRILRFAGNNPTATNGHAVPLPGAMVFTACQGSALGN